MGEAKSKAVPRPRVCAALLLAASLSAASNVTAETGAPGSDTSGPFSFRGIALGTSLADLRRMQFAEAPGARILCSHDAEAGDIRPTAEYVAPDAEASAGAVVCAAYTFGKILGPASKVLPSEWLTARLDVGAIVASPFFWFVPKDKEDVEETARLYRIAIRSNSAYWPQARAAYTRRYGPATTSKTVMLQQEGKRDIAAEILTWANAESTIVLAQRDEVASRMTITFEHTDLFPRGGDGSSGRR